MKLLQCSKLVRSGRLLEWALQAFVGFCFGRYGNIGALIDIIWFGGIFYYMII